MPGRISRRLVALVLCVREVGEMTPTAPTTTTSSDITTHHHQYDVVIVGAGGAGMRADIEAGPHAKTAVISSRSLAFILSSSSSVRDS